MNFVGTSKAATIRVKQIATVRETATTYSAVSGLLIARGMTSSIATIGGEKNAG
jgi:hypothetical protein